jgi:hypothetical protein
VFPGRNLEVPGAAGVERRAPRRIDSAVLRPTRASVIVAARRGVAVEVEREADEQAEVFECRDDVCKSTFVCI